MRIEKIRLYLLRNEQHYQYHTEFKELIEQYTAKALNIEKEFAEYLPLYQLEDETLKVIRKSAITESLADADAHRDTSFRGFANAIKVAMQHFNTDVREAAKRVKIIIDTYGNVPQKPYDEESAAITNILQELQDKYAEDIALMNLTEWVNKLEQDNTHFLTLVKDRYQDLNLELISKMPIVRKDIDNIYIKMVERINALIIVEGQEKYQPFAEAINQRIAHYRTVLAQRQGRGKKNKEEGEMPENN